MTATRSARRRKRKKHKNLQAAGPNLNGLNFQAAVSFNDETLQASEDGEAKIPSFTIQAYNGGKMRPRGFPSDVVFDLSSSKSKSVPIFMDHDTSGRGLVGHADTAHDGQTLSATGIVSADTESAQIVVKAAKRGFPWQASIGASIQSKKFIASDEQATVNGRIHEGPFHVIKGQLHEISFVPIGADQTTSAQIAANAARSKQMAIEDANDVTAVVEDPVEESIQTVKADKDTADFTKWLVAQGFDDESELSEKALHTLKAAYKLEKEEKEKNNEQKHIDALRETSVAEIKRQRDVMEMTRFNHDLQIQALQENWSSQRTELEVLKAELRKGPISTSSTKNTNVSGEVLEAALCLQTDGIEAEWLDKKQPHWKKTKYKGYSEETLDAATDVGQLSFSRLFQSYLHANRISVPPMADMDTLISAVKDSRRTLKAHSSGFSTVDISGILSNVMGKSMLAAFTSANAAAQAVSSSRSVSDFKETKAFRMTGNGDFLPIAPTGELQLMQLQEEEFPNRPITYGRMIAVNRTMLINDDMGALTAVTTILGRKAALKLQKEFFTLWLNLQAGSAFFAAGNNNLATSNPLGIEGLTAAEKLFLDQTDADGDPVDIMPSILLVPTGLKVTAEVLMNSTVTIMENRLNDATSQIGDLNPHRGKFTVVSTPWLNAQGITGSSETSWYLLATPNELAAAEIVYLNGRTAPFIEGEDTDFSVLGFQWRSYFDFGIAQQDHRAAVKSTT